MIDLQFRHLTGEAMKALLHNGVDVKKRIVGTLAPHPFLFNVPMEMIARFRKLTLPIVFFIICNARVA